MTLTTRIIDAETGAPIEGRIFTPYAAAGVVNAELADKGYDITIRPQMFYNYIRQGMLATVSVEGTNGKVQKMVREDVLAEWLSGYLARAATRAAKKMQAATK